MPRIQDATIEEGQDISAEGVIAEADLKGDVLVSLNIEGTAAASYALDVSATGEDGDWFKGEETYDQANLDDATDIRDSFRFGHRHLRVRVTDPAAAGETADVTISEAR